MYTGVLTRTWCEASLSWYRLCVRVCEQNIENRQSWVNAGPACHAQAQQWANSRASTHVEHPACVIMLLVLSADYTLSTQVIVLELQELRSGTVKLSKLRKQDTTVYMHTVNQKKYSKVDLNNDRNTERCFPFMTGVRTCSKHSWIIFLNLICSAYNISWYVQYWNKLQFEEW